MKDFLQLKISSETLKDHAKIMNVVVGWLDLKDEGSARDVVIVEERVDGARLCIIWTLINQKLINNK